MSIWLITFILNLCLPFSMIAFVILSSKQNYVTLHNSVFSCLEIIPIIQKNMMVVILFMHQVLHQKIATLLIL